MTSTSHLTLVGRDRRAEQHQPIDPIVGDGRPSAVRALLARSITMTAHELERRLRTLRRQPSSRALRQVSTAAAENTGDRADRLTTDAMAIVSHSAALLR